MDKFLINGQKKLKGEIEVSGAKNCALKLLPASLLTDQTCVFNNVPEIRDVEIMVEILKDLGAEVEHPGKGKYIVTCKNINKIDPNPELVKKLRSSIMLLAPMLARMGEVKFPHPGGCIIGKRPIDLYIDGLKTMGVEMTEKEDHYHLKTKGLKGARYVFPWISHTVTETMVMAASMAKGDSVLVNAACEPEVHALAEFLNSCGAKISGHGSHEIKITGVEKLSGGETTVIPDRIEAGTFAIMGALVGDGVTIKKCNPMHLEVFWKMLERVGVDFKLGDDFVIINPSKNLMATEVRTHEYPGLVTDLQAPFTVLLTQAQGLSLVHETIYEGRLFYTDKLNKMGAYILMCDPHRVVVNGPTKLFGTKMESPDLRAGISLLLAALVAEGQSEIENIYQIDRGYEDIENRLTTLGADIKRVSDCA